MSPEGPPRAGGLILVPWVPSWSPWLPILHGGFLGCQKCPCPPDDSDVVLGTPGQPLPRLFCRGMDEGLSTEQLPPMGRRAGTHRAVLLPLAPDNLASRTRRRSHGGNPTTVGNPPGELRSRGLGQGEAGWPGQARRDVLQALGCQMSSPQITRPSNPSCLRPPDVGFTPPSSPPTRPRNDRNVFSRLTSNQSQGSALDK